MYSTCLFCNQSLGANEVVEAFPVGRRLAFDQRRGRLWVVCRKCEKWNLTPLEERWEAIETCEQLFRDTKKRVSTDNIGLARLKEGLELVRIGEPQRSEFAAWRYGDQFGRRRRRTNLIYGGATVIGAAALVANVHSMAVGTSLVTSIIGGAYGFAQWSFLGGQVYRNRRVLAEIKSGDVKWKIRGRFASALRLIPSEAVQGWALEVPVEKGEVRQRIVVEGLEARRIIGRVMPSLTPWGAKDDQILQGVKRIEDAGDPDKYLRWLARNPRQIRDYMGKKDVVTRERRKRGTLMDTLGVQAPDACLAVEMAVNEENERIALDGELAALEDAWKEAEEIAGIADDLALPRDVEHGLDSLRRTRAEQT